MTSIEETYDPGPVKKRRAASLATAVVAGIAGIALAATMFTFTQGGSADAKQTNTSPGVVSTTRLDLGVLPWQGFGYTDSTPAHQPDSVSHTDFTLTNKDVAKRQVVTLISVASDAAPGTTDPLYSDIWVHITRRNPTGEGASNEVYNGSLSNLAGKYMGNIVAGGSQTFDVYAWTASPHANATSVDHSNFTVTYSQFDGAADAATTSATKNIPPH